MPVCGNSAAPDVIDARHVYAPVQARLSQQGQLEGRICDDYGPQTLPEEQSLHRAAVLVSRPAAPMSSGVGVIREGKVYCLEII